MNWSWSDVYPDHKVLTVILPPALEAELCEQFGVRVVGENVVVLERLKAPSKRPQKAFKPAPKPAQTTAAKTPAAPAKKPKPARATQKAMTHLAAGAVKQLRRTVSDDLPPRPPAEAHPPSVVSKGDLALVSKAIANGEVSITVCPPMTFTPEDEVVPLNEPAKMRKHRMARRKQRLEREGAQQEAKGV